jgi:trehalose 6-phosphate synthase
MRPAWTRGRLQALIREGLGDRPLIVVSNREPWVHRRHNGAITAERPASGLVTALEPFAEASGGTWIAHGSGDADRRSVDANDSVAVPPGDPSYRLRRLWLSDAEQDGYYTNLANRGLWPLCHVAFVPPLFEASHWQTYRAVNQRFAEAVLQEANGQPAVVFLQDFHLALVPALLRQANSSLTVAQFWHVPWPNLELLRTFPYADQLVEGLLGNDLIGFQIPAHASNFVDAATALLQVQPTADGQALRVDGHCTQVASYPISIDFQQWSGLAASDAVAEAMRRWRQRLGAMDPHLLGVGMERLDYTKGLPQRLRAVERLLQRQPQLQGRFRFVQVLANSRSQIAEYHALHQELEALVERINGRWGTGDWQPLELRIEEIDLIELIALQRLGAFCVVSSLHDGMNLVAKEFVAARCDGDGVLILSRFAGSALELADALQVHPYNVEELADAMAQALAMPESERRRRMGSLRRQVEEHNVYRWGGRILTDILHLQQ